VEAIAEIDVTAPVGSNKAAEERAVGLFREIKDHARAERRRFDHVWWENGRYFQGNHWPWNRPLWKSAPTTNFCASAIIPSIALLTDNRPRPEVMALDPSNYHTAAALHESMEWVLRDQDFELLLPQVLLSAAILGTGFFETDYDPFRKRIIVRQRDTYDVMVLGGIDVEQCEFVLVRSWLPLYRIRQLYPRQGPRVKAEAVLTEPIYDGERRPRESVPGGHFLRNAATMYDLAGKNPMQFYTLTPESGSGDTKFAQGASVWQFYMRDPNRDRYPTWRHITLSGDVVLADRPIRRRNGRIPLVKFNNFDWDSEFWGRPEIHDIKGPNTTHNLTHGMILDCIRVGMMPPLLFGALSGFDSTSWMVKPGLALPYDERGGKPYWMPPIPISPVMFSLLSMNEGHIRALTGQGDAPEGALPFKGASGVLVAQMREAAQTRVRQKARNLEVAMKRLGEQIVSDIQQFWTEEKTLPLVGPPPPERLASLDPKGLVLGRNEEVTAFVVNRVLDVIPPKFPGDKPQPIMLNDVSIGEYVVRVNGVSGRPLSRRAMLVEAIELFKIGAVDRQYVWKLLDVPEQEKVRMMAEFERMRREAMAQQQQMAAMKQGGQAPQLPAAAGVPAIPEAGAEPEVPVGSEMGSGVPTQAPPAFVQNAV